MNDNEKLNFASALRAPLILVILSLAARLIIIILFPSPVVTIDSLNYIAQADDLLNGKFGLYFPNGYPALLALISLISGWNFLQYSVLLLNIILAVASAFLFFRILVSHTEKFTIPFVFSIIFALYPNQLNYTRFLLTEVPALFFLLLAFYFIQKKEYTYAGFTAGIAASMKTEIIPVLIFFPVYLLIQKNLKSGLTFLGSSVIPLLIMIIYGFIITSRLTIGDSALHNFYITAGEHMLPDHNFFKAAGFYLNYALSDPLQFIIERLYSIWNFWGFIAPANEGLRSDIFYRLLIGIRFPLLLLALYGFLRSPKDELIVFSALVLSVITAIHFIFYSSPRYNFIVEPFLIFLAMKGVMILHKNYSRSLTRPQKLS